MATACYRYAIAMHQIPTLLTVWASEHHLWSSDPHTLTSWAQILTMPSPQPSDSHIAHPNLTFLISWNCVTFRGQLSFGM